jgi:uncharacterized protein YecE (DUF72 family)
MRKGLFIGTSGWSYPDEGPNGWKGTFYESTQSMLKQYLNYFDTAEINSTFYALPQPNFIKHLAGLKDESKFFTAKLPKKVTHDSRLRLEGEGGQVLEQFFSLMHPLKDRIASLLIQLPPWDITNMGDLESFFSSLDENFRYAIEFRHESWLKDRVWNLLEDYGIAHVVVDEPKLPIDLRVTADFSYVRWHGHGGKLWYMYRYSKEEIEAWKPRVEQLLSDSKTVLGYWNNHFSGNAPLNAFQMLQLMNQITPQQEKKLQRMLSATAVEQTSLDDF